MKTQSWVGLMMVGLIASAAMAADDEGGLIAVLRSPQATVEQKDAACQKLRVGGTARCVPALAGLLVDENLSQSALMAMERMQFPEAGQALRDAMGKTNGKTKAGIIDALGERRDAQSVEALKGLLADADETVASSAALALGKIGGKEALASLQAARAKAAPALRAVVVDALLICADRMLASGDRSAEDVYLEVHRSENPVYVRIAALRGAVLAKGLADPDAAVDLVDGWLGVQDFVAIKVSLQLVSELKGEKATRRFASQLEAMWPFQVPLLEALASRGDPAAAPEVAKLLGSEDPEVRRAAIAALGTLGDSSVAVRLAEVAARAAGQEQEAARQALAVIRDAKVKDVLLEALPRSVVAVQGEIVRALGARRETEAVPALIGMAKGNDPQTRMLALYSLALLAEQSHVEALIGLVTGAESDGERGAAGQALVAACARGGRVETCVPKVVGAMKGADAASRAVLLRVAGRLGGGEALAALRAAIGDADAAIQDVALRTLAEYGPIDAMDDLLKLANSQQRTDGQRVLALRGYWRLVGVANDRSVEDRWKMCEVGMAAARRAEERRLGLSELAKVPHASALKLAETLCGDEAVRTEAELACVRIAAALAGAQPDVAKAALRRVEKDGKGDAIRAEARKAMETMDQYSGFVTKWSVAGPFRQQEKQCAELFDIPFAPEQAGAKVEWKRLAPPSDPGLFWQADLLPIADGEQCVAYVKSRIWSPKQQRVRLEIGSDDGNKVWVNGKVVHAKNIMRPIQAGTDRAEATLNEGWNEMMIKVTQNNMGFAVCVRIRETDGSPVEGLKFNDGTAASLGR